MRLLHLVAIGFQIGDEFLHRIGREILARDDDRWRIGGDADRDKVALGIVTHIRRQHRRCDMRAHAAGQQRIAIGIGRGDATAAERAAGAADILDHHRLPKMLCHAVGDDARDDIARTASGERTTTMIDREG